MTRIITVVEMTLRDISRRRGVFGLLLALPLVFYLARREDANGQAIKFVLLGVGFTISTAALFVTTAARWMDQRLRLSGYRIVDLYGGRFLALLTIGLVIAIPYFGIVALDQRVERLAAVGLALTLTVAVGAPLGMALGALVPRELEGALLLIGLLTAQFLTDPARPISKGMPFWSARELGTYAIDLTDSGYLWRGVAHGLVSASLFAGFCAVVAAIRLRRGQRPRYRLTACSTSASSSRSRQ